MKTGTKTDSFPCWLAKLNFEGKCSVTDLPRSPCFANVQAQWYLCSEIQLSLLIKDYAYNKLGLFYFHGKLSSKIYASQQIHTLKFWASAMRFWSCASHYQEYIHNRSIEVDASGFWVVQHHDHGLGRMQLHVHDSWINGVSLAVITFWFSDQIQNNGGLAAYCFIFAALFWERHKTGASFWALYNNSRWPKNYYIMPVRERIPHHFHAPFVRWWNLMLHYPQALVAAFWVTYFCSLCTHAVTWMRYQFLNMQCARYASVIQTPPQVNSSVYTSFTYHRSFPLTVHAYSKPLYRNVTTECVC